MRIRKRLYPRQLTFRQRPRLIPVGDIQRSRHGTMKGLGGTEIRYARIVIGVLFVETVIRRYIAECGLEGDVRREKGVTWRSVGSCGHFRENLTWATRTVRWRLQVGGGIPRSDDEEPFSRLRDSIICSFQEPPSHRIPQLQKRLDSLHKVRFIVHLLTESRDLFHDDHPRHNHLD